MIVITKLYHLIHTFMTLTFIQGHRATTELGLLQYFCC